MHRMDFAPSARATEMLARLQSFLDERVLPAEPVYAEQRAGRRGRGRPHDLPPVVEELKAEAREPRAVEPVPARGRPGSRCSTTRRSPS